MAGSRSPPLAFIAPPTLPAFAPGEFVLQQLPFRKASGEPSAHTLSSLHDKYESLLSHERQGKELERSVWETERYLYLQRISALEDTVKDLQTQLDAKPSCEPATADLPDKPHPADTAPPHTDNIVEQIIEVPAPETRDWPEEQKDAPRADTPGPPEYPYPKTPKSVKGDVEPDDAQIENLLDQAGRILGKTSYKFHHSYDDEYDDPEEDFKLILKPNRNFRSNWAF